ncbi:MAG: DUF4376 domain-containing protein [Akkermansia sp.]|nr:DUF4376 domain-containing protein [Akkermansia sp.]
MKTYAKLEDGALRMMGRVPNVINPTEVQVAGYAAAHGFKELITTPQPGRYWRRDDYVETPNGIYEVWTTQELADAKTDALERVQRALDSVLDARATIPCAGFPAGIVYDRNALINAGGLAAGVTFIDAADGIHTLTAQDVAAITAALKEYRQGLYATATLRRAAIAAAEDVDELPQE